MDLNDFLIQTFNSVLELGGLPWAAKIIVIVNLLIASMKVSIVKQYAWDKFGALKVLVAPLLGLMIGYLSLHDRSVPALMSYVLAGNGAILLHEILDGVKSFPMVNDKHKVLVEFVKGFIGGKKS